MGVFATIADDDDAAIGLCAGFCADVSKVILLINTMWQTCDYRQVSH